MVDIGIGSFLPSASSIKLGGLLFVGFIGFIIILAVIFGVMLYLGRFRLKIEVEEKRGKGQVQYTTRGGIVKNRKTGVKELVIWRHKNNPAHSLRSGVPDWDLFRTDLKGKRVLRIYKDSVDTFKIIPPVNEEDAGKPVDLDWYNWASQSLKGNAERYRNDRGILRENAGIIGLFGVIFLVMVIVIVGFSKWEEGTGNLAATAAQVAETSQNLKEVSGGFRGVQYIEDTTPNVQDNAPAQQIQENLPFIT